MRVFKTAASVAPCILVVLRLFLAGALPAPSETVHGNLGRQLDTYMSRLEKFGFSGALLVAKGGEIVLAKGYGLADRARRIPVTTDTVFSIGSITKQFTAAAILKLELQGKLRVDNPIGKFFPNVPPDKAPITIHHLLTHTAGLRADYGGGDFDAVSRDALVQLVFATPLASLPGKEYRYSNEGYSLLGAIIEIVTGQTYERYLHENLFKPAGMASTGYVIPKWKRDDIARGYIDGRDWGTILEKPWAPDGPYWHLRANGGIHSTIGDMYKWHLALAGDAILSKEAKKKYFTPYVPEGLRAQSFYAYGWAVFTTPRKTRLIAHSGSNGIFAADFRRYVDENVVVFAASNAEVSAIDLSAQLARIVFGMDYVMPPPVVAVDSAVRARYAGTYQFPSGEQIVVSVEGEGLKISASGGETFALLNSLAPAGSARFADIEARTRALVEASAKGDYKPMHEAFGSRIPLAEVEAMESNLWQERRRRYGELKRTEILGSASRGRGVATFVRLDFEHGMQFLRYMWDGGVLAGARTLPKPPEAVFLPQSASEFASFNLRDPSPVHIRFDVSVDGSVTGLTLAGMTAKKIN